MSRTNTEAWIAYRRPRPQARLRLFCFPYAGGGATVYRPWVRQMPPEIDVCPVQLPGREQRLRDRPFTRVAPLVEVLAESLAPLLDEGPFAFFGHSMGATIAYELTHRLSPERRPTHLLVSARRAPQVPPDDEPIYDLPAAEFRAKLQEMEGTPQEVLEHEELMDLVEPLLRADFELIETYPPTEHPPLDVPITAFGGVTDSEVSREMLEAWEKVTTGPFRLRMFAGGHFYLHQQKGPLAAAVSESLLR
jgi:medium-chain acyl-[acyl-carrier-protein] hydrolase